MVVSPLMPPRTWVRLLAPYQKPRWNNYICYPSPTLYHQTAATVIFLSICLCSFVTWFVGFKLYFLNCSFIVEVVSIFFYPLLYFSLICCCCCWLRCFYIVGHVALYSILSVMLTFVFDFVWWADVAEALHAPLAFVFLISVTVTWNPRSHSFLKEDSGEVLFEFFPVNNVCL